MKCEYQNKDKCLEDVIGNEFIECEWEGLCEYRGMVKEDYYLSSKSIDPDGQCYRCKVGYDKR